MGIEDCDKDENGNILIRYAYTEDDEGEYQEIERPSAWANRATITTREGAMAAVVDWLSDYGIGDAVSNKMDEVEALCAKWEIPFNRDLHHKITNLMAKRRWATDDEYRTHHYWTSSSEGC